MHLHAVKSASDDAEMIIQAYLPISRVKIRCIREEIHCAALGSPKDYNWDYNNYSTADHGVGDDGSNCSNPWLYISEW